MMNPTDKEVQNIFRNKLMKGPVVRMNVEETEGVYRVSGTQASAFYELYGKTQIFRLLILKPSSVLFTSQYVSKKHVLMLLMEEDEQMKGGFTSNLNNFEKEIANIFPHLKPKALDELLHVWMEYGKGHYFEELEAE